MIREISESDFDGLFRLYMQLHDNPFPDKDDRIIAIWNNILGDKNHHIIAADENGRLVSSCVCVIIPNLTRGQRPYAFVVSGFTLERTAALIMHKTTQRSGNCVSYPNAVLFCREMLVL